jgi:hypothetical protein
MQVAVSCDTLLKNNNFLSFLVYINDLPSNIKEAKLVLFVDDTNILVVGKDEEDLQPQIFSIIKQLEVWFFNNDLIVIIINPSACRHLIPSSYYVVGRFCCRVFKF